MAAHLNRRSLLSWALAAPLAATAACTGPASAASPSGTPRAGQATTEPPSRARPGSLGVGALTYNIMTSRKRRIDRMPEEALDDLVWENRIDTVAAKMLSGNPDVIALQENEGLPAGGEKQITGLLRLAPDHDVSPYADPEDTLQVLFRRSAFTATDGGSFRINERGRDDAPKDRYCVWARLRHHASGRSLLVFNVHLTSSGSIERARFRAYEWSRLTEGLQRISPGMTEPYLLMGDFNASSTETRPVYDAHLRTMRELGMVDAAVVAQRNDSAVPDAHSMNQMGALVAERWRHGAIRRGGEHIDYICTGASSVVTSLEVVLDAGPGREVRDLTVDGVQHPFFAEGPIGSDHNPVLAHVTFPA